jgi:hypothetical protein
MNTLRVLSKIDELSETVDEFKSRYFTNKADDRLIESIYQSLSNAISTRQNRARFEEQELADFKTPEKFKKPGQLHNSAASLEEAISLQGSSYFIIIIIIIIII